MALARASRVCRTLLTSAPRQAAPAVAVTAVRHAAHWNYQWAPGPYPKTQAEREAAAKKYNLQPEDYEPHPDDWRNLGDYPKLPEVSTDSRDPFYPWDHDVYKINYAEPLPENYNLIGADRLDLTSPHRYSLPFQWAVCVGSILFFLGIYYLPSSKPYVAMPIMPKQFPDTGRAHYTFDPVD